MGEYRFGHFKPCRDIKTGRLPGQTQAQLVGGLQGRFVEPHGGIQHARRSRAVQLQRQQMRRGETKGTRLAKLIENCDADRTAFFGIRGAAKLVEENE